MKKKWWLDPFYWHSMAALLALVAAALFMFKNEIILGCIWSLVTLGNIICAALSVKEDK
jgi:hypothetical protein